MCPGPNGPERRRRSGWPSWARVGGASHRRTSAGGTEAPDLALREAEEALGRAELRLSVRRLSRMKPS